MTDRQATPLRVMLGIAVAGGLALSGCENSAEADATRALQDLNMIDETNLNEIMLTAADPREAVNYFRQASGERPDRIDLRRALARSLVRAGLASEAVGVWREVADAPSGTSEDRVQLADALLRTNEWDKGAAELARVPPTHETFDRYRLEAMLADHRKQWSRADSYYETAVGLTTRPAGVLNNWGFSKLTRGQPAEAERMFREALTYDQNLFAAKNNMAIARGAQRNYTLPVIQMTQVERAELTYTLALAALKQNDVVIGRTLLQEAIDTHPQHFDLAVRALRALDTQGTTTG